MTPSFYITAVYCLTALNLQCIWALPVYQQPNTVTGVMGSELQLPGFLINADTIEKNGVQIDATEDIYELRHTTRGIRVIIKMLTCTDEGTYAIGGVNFHLKVIPGQCNVFYFTAKATKRDAALISPLSQVSRISKFYVSSKKDSWTLLEIWNDTMSTRISPGYCCFMVNNGTTFGGYIDDHYRYYVYEIQGGANDNCSAVQKTERREVSCSKQELDLHILESIKTDGELENISDGRVISVVFFFFYCKYKTHQYYRFILFFFPQTQQRSRNYWMTLRRPGLPEGAVHQRQLT